MRTEYGTRVKEFTRAVESGPPYLVRYSWAGGNNMHERDLVTEAIAACFGVKTLGLEQTIRNPEDKSGPVADRVRYAFWLLRIFDLSLGFTHGWQRVELGSSSKPAGAHPSTGLYRVSMLVDRSRRWDNYDEY